MEMASIIGDTLPAFRKMKGRSKPKRIRDGFGNPMALQMEIILVDLGPSVNSILKRAGDRRRPIRLQLLKDYETCLILGADCL
jgi:hypothetical protein